MIFAEVDIRLSSKCHHIMILTDSSGLKWMKFLTTLGEKMVLHSNSRQKLLFSCDNICPLLVDWEIYFRSFAWKGPYHNGAHAQTWSVFFLRKTIAEPLSSAEAQRVFSGGENPLSNVSSGPGFRLIEPFDFAPANIWNSEILKRTFEPLRRREQLNCHFDASCSQVFHAISAVYTLSTACVFPRK